MTTLTLTNLKNNSPGLRIVVAMLRKSNDDLLEINKNQTEQITKLTVQIDDLRHMLFGQKSEKMPSMQSEVRRAVDEEELFPSEETGQIDELTDEEKKTIRKKKARAKSEPKRKANRKLKKSCLSSMKRFRLPKTKSLKATR